MGSKTKIDWCDATWNPVTGCLHKCEYCYARGIARRFGGHLQGCIEPGIYELVQPMYDITPMSNELERVGRKLPYPYDFEPTFHRYKLKEPQHWKKPRTIFVCSMADLFGEWVPDEWIKAVFDACDAAPWHRYIFLTKNPKRYTNMANAHLVKEWNKKHSDKPHSRTQEFAGITPLPVRDNWWYGSTLDNANARRFQGDFTWHSFTSIEPLTEFMDMGLGSFGTDEWTIIGAETGNRKGKIIPKREWIDNILDAASITEMKVFMKESLREIMGEDFRQEFPWEADA